MVILAIGVFYLFEENAFLRAQQADPTLKRVPGERTGSMHLLDRMTLYFWLAGPLILFALTVRARGPSLKEYFRRERDLMLKERLLKERCEHPLFRPPVIPLGDWTRSLAIAGGLILVGFSVLVVATTIRALVWEGNPTPPVILILAFILFTQIYPPIYLGLLIFRVVIQDFRLVHYGLPASPENMSSRQLTEQEIEPIRRALEDDDWRAAIKRYREAVPEASRAEAKAAT